MTDSQFEVAKTAYENEHPGKRFEDLRLWQMNEYLAKLGMHPYLARGDSRWEAVQKWL